MSKLFASADAEELRQKICEAAEDNSHEHFDRYIDKFITANKRRLDFLKSEAFDFINQVVQRFPEENLVISFSGGKDSTVTADLS